MPIKVLDPQLIARIAAGEVVERPASAVKELVENALDAGATQIVVETREGGTTLIRVTDNGSGIPPSEVELAFARHATSKISSFDDLESISTLGFRGEALAAIAAVAEVELATCTSDAAGSYVRLKNGDIIEQTSQGRSQGTTVTVRNLFRNVPARLKFLKSPNIENGRVANVVTQYALAFPDVAFTLSMEGRTVLRTSGGGHLIDAIVEAYGADVAKNMLEVGGKGEYQGASEIKVTGMAGTPAVNRTNRNFLSFFVNHRWVNSKLLSFAVEEAYHGMMMTGKHPIAVLNISIPAAEIDVNIHPAKTEIKFHDEHQVFAAVQRAVRQILVAPFPSSETRSKIEEPPAAFAALPPGTVPLPFVVNHDDKSSIRHTPDSRPVPAFSLPALRLLGQIAATYIVAEGPDGLYLIDQHAAHERVQFERVTSQMSVKKVEVQGLLEPVTFEVDPRQESVLRSHLADLADCGFLLEPFGARTYLVRTIPACLHRKDWTYVLRELTDDVDTGSKWTEKLAQSIACHSAVRAGQVMTVDEMRELLRQLEKTALPGNCPHGRPTMIRLTVADLEREFGRRG
ncbi:MAG: DNA mismatch repair endonuclease MutL [Dehalococcoidales bacterium]|nr:DNA mismatch repair endonuclease MutL [Dehalococcoidales bacterium]